MIGSVIVKAFRLLPAALVAAGLLLPAPLAAETAKKGPMVRAAPEPEPEPEPEAKAEEIAPSTGVNVLDRMGVELPELPAEKPFDGQVDEAYGAFQRGYYLTAMELALPRGRWRQRGGDVPLRADPDGEAV